VAVFRWHTQPLYRVALEIKFNHDGWLAPDHPTIVSRFDGNGLRRGELKSASIGILNMDLAAREEPDVRVLAEFGADNGLHVARPAESRRVNYALHSAVARAGHVELHASDFAVLGSFHRGGQWIVRHSAALQS